MKHASDNTVTQLLARLRADHSRSIFDELFPLIYKELQELAYRQRRHWSGDQTLNTTALVNEAYLKLVDQTQATWENRAHFFATAAKVMRHILFNYARSRRAQKRGGYQQKLSLDDVKISENGNLFLSDEGAETLIVLNKALERLEQISQRQSQIVECRFFAGMTIEETAAALSISPPTVSRGWKLAQVWLYRELKTELNRD